MNIEDLTPAVLENDLSTDCADLSMHEGASMIQKNIVIVDPDPVFRADVRNILAQSFMGFQIYGADGGEDGLKVLQENGAILTFCACQLPDMEFAEFAKRIRFEAISTVLIVESENPFIEQVIKCIKAGAVDFLRRPFTTEALIRLTKEHLQSFLPDLNDTGGDSARSYQQVLIGESISTRKIKELIGKIAPTDNTILIYGEAGTEKGIVASEIHSRSIRKDNPFIAVNCSAMPNELIEAEFFGYSGFVKGNFIPGRLLAKDHKGIFERANHGTIFLDEIETLPLDLQIKLLWVMEEGR